MSSQSGSGPRAWLVALVGTRTAPKVADTVLLVARLILAWIFIYHGARRLFGWFDGPGISASADYFANVAGLKPGTFFAVSGGIIEFFGGIALALGLLTRLAAAGLVVDMVMAIVTVTWANGINATGDKGGYELNLALGCLALVLVGFGAGRISLDALAERRLLGAAPVTATGTG